MGMMQDNNMNMNNNNTPFGNMNNQNAGFNNNEMQQAAGAFAQQNKGGVSNPFAAG